MKQRQKPEIIFVVENKLGGVAYLNKNIINNTSLLDQTHVKLILLDQTDSNHPRFKDHFNAHEIIHFQYSEYENRFAVLKRLAANFGGGEGAIICNDGLEMQAIYKYGTRKTVYQIIHDFYNLKLAVKLGAITDVFVAHTKLFRDVLLSADPEKNDVFYLPHGVTIPAIDPLTKKGAPLKLVFTGRLVESKGVQDLFAINEHLKKKNVEVEWTIIGKGPLKEFLLDQWKQQTNVSFAAPDTSEEVIALMKKSDLFVLPTRFEGSPVTVLEALSAGVVPIVSDLPGGITEIVEENIGRRIPVTDNELFADAIASFHADRDLLLQLKGNGRALAESKFNILTTANDYFNLFLRYAEFKKSHDNLPPLPIGFRLDKEWLPNPLVSFLRKKTK
jgi:glycosyltransferase involved in cell wall biosynthesis